ncbi:MAG TPA: ACT domain-containing protein [Verrucomicrobiae bacterium]
MKLKITRAEVWAATIEDRPGGLSEKLSALAKAGANLEFIISRRKPDRRGEGVAFVTPVKGAQQVKAAKASGFSKTDSLHSVRVEGTDKPGLGSALSKALAEAGLNLRGLSAAAFGRRFVAYLALDTAGAAAKAVNVLKKL